MEYTIDELAREAGTSSSTIRYYQGEAILDPPRVVGRIGYYDGSHLDRLIRIARLKERGFSLAGIRELLQSQGKNRSAASIVLGSEKEGRGDVLAALIAVSFPDEGLAAAPIQTAISLGVLAVDGDGVRVTDESLYPMVVATLRLFQLGIPESESIEVWSHVQEHIGALASKFSQLARSFVYSKMSKTEFAEAYSQLTAAAHEIVGFALQQAIEVELGELLDQEP